MTKEPNSTAKEQAQVHYYVYAVAEPKKHWQKARWTRLGVIFTHDDGQGGNIVLDAMPINFDGRLVYRTPLQDAAAPDAE